MKSSFKLSEIPSIVKTNFGLDVVVESQLDSYDDQNFLVRITSTSLKPENFSHLCQHGYVFKVLNADVSENPKTIDIQTKMILHLVRQDFPTPVPVLSINGRYQEQVQAVHNTEQGFAETTHIIRLFEFKPGTPLNEVPLTAQLCYEIGLCAGKMDLALKMISNTEWDMSCLKNKWDLAGLPHLRQNTDVIKYVEKRSMIENIIDEFDKCILQKLPSFSKGLIHSDLNECNILVERCPFSSNNSSSQELQKVNPGTPDSGFLTNDELNQMKSKAEYNLCGIIDFGDATHSLYIFEVAIAIAYAMLNKHGITPTVAAHEILKGYLENMTLSHWELMHLRLVICARYAQSLVMGQIAFAKSPENEYILIHAKRIWPVLENLWHKSNQEVFEEIMGLKYM